MCFVKRDSNITNNSLYYNLTKIAKSRTDISTQTSKIYASVS